MATARAATNELGLILHLPKIGTGGFGDTKRIYKTKNQTMERITLKQFCVALCDYYYLEQFINDNRLASKIKTYEVVYKGTDKHGGEFKIRKGLSCKFKMYGIEFTATSLRGQGVAFYIGDKVINNIHTFKNRSVTA